MPIFLKLFFCYYSYSSHLCQLESYWFFEALLKGYFLHAAFPNVISFFLKHTNLFAYTSLRDSYYIFPHFYYSLCLLFPLPSYEYLESWNCLLIFIVSESYIDFKAVLIVWHVIILGTIKKEKIPPIQLSPCFITYFKVSLFKELIYKMNFLISLKCLNVS